MNTYECGLGTCIQDGDHGAIEGRGFCKCPKCETGKLCSKNEQCGSNGKCKKYRELADDILDDIGPIPRSINLVNLRLSSI